MDNLSLKPRPTRIERLDDVEAVVPRVLARVARQPLLFVVLDGCGLPSFSELAPQFGEAGFREIVRGRFRGRRRPDQRPTWSGSPRFPTVTEVSRASLIAGHLDRGNQDHERTQFESNSAIRRDGQSAVFFHQNRLAGPAGESFSAEVLEALGPTGPAVVGVVINTIDDHLRKGTFADELRIADVGPLVSLLEAAEERRPSGSRQCAITVTSWPSPTTADPGCSAAAATAASVGGKPIGRLPMARSCFVASGCFSVPWPESSPPGRMTTATERRQVATTGRHSSRKCWCPSLPSSPQVSRRRRAGSPSSRRPPLWWDLWAEGTRTSEPPASERAGKSRKKAKPVDEAQGSMFVETTDSPEPSGAVAALAPAWVDALFASDVWKDQKSKVGPRRVA